MWIVTEHKWKWKFVMNWGYNGSWNKVYILVNLFEPIQSNSVTWFKLEIDLNLFCAHHWSSNYTQFERFFVIIHHYLQLFHLLYDLPYDSVVNDLQYKRSSRNYLFSISRAWLEIKRRSVRLLTAVEDYRKGFHVVVRLVFFFAKVIFRF